MARDKQYKEDSVKLSLLIEKYTNIPQDRIYQFVMENTAENLLSNANKLCKNPAQREKLNSLFEFKKLYETVKGAENREYRLDSTSAAMEYFKNYFADVKDKEHFAVTYLNTQLKVIKTDTISDGTVAQAHVYPREIYKEALFINAAAVMISHNHPSGELTPSSMDIDITQRIKMGMELVGLKLIDHIIVGGEKATSLADTGYIKDNLTISDLNKVSLPIRENTKILRTMEKPLRIKEQLALAEKQMAVDNTSQKQQSQKRSNKER